MELHPIRTIDYKGATYLRKEDVVRMLREEAEKLETDSKKIVQQLADNMVRMKVL